MNRLVHGCRGAAAHRHLQEWLKDGFFWRFCRSGLSECDEVKGIDLADA